MFKKNQTRTMTSFTYEYKGRRCLLKADLQSGNRLEVRNLTEENTGYNAQL